MKLLERPSLHPFLFAVYPILFLFAKNAYEMHGNEIWIPLLYVLIGAALVLAVFSVLFRSILKGSLLASAVILCFMSFGHLMELTQSFSYRIGGWEITGTVLVTGIEILLLLVICYVLFRITTVSVKFISVVNVIALVLVLIQIGQAGYVVATRELPGEEPEQEIVIGESPEGARDIYYFVLDGYGRHDVMNEIYEFDNSEFLDSLRQLGFYIADSSHSNYAQTLLSVSSSLNMSYISDIGDFYRLSHDRMPLAYKTWDNRLVNYLRKMGYRFVSFATGLNFTEFEEADYFLTPEGEMSQFEHVVLASTPVPYLFDLEKSQYDLHRERIEYLFEGITGLDEVAQPKFVFGHIIAPHPPFVYDAEGNGIEPDRPYSITDGTGFMQHGGSKEEYIRQFREQSIYISHRVLEVVTELLGKYPEDKQPIVIIQGDHGPGSGTHWNLVKMTDMWERMSILNAYYLPGEDAVEKLYPEVSPVNSFRLVLNEYFSDTLTLLPDSSFFSTFSYPYYFYDVTDECRIRKEN